MRAATGYSKTGLFLSNVSADNRTQRLWIDGVIGELLYVPEGWHHATLNYGETLVRRHDIAAIWVAFFSQDASDYRCGQAVAQQARIGRSEWLRLRLLGTQLANARAFAEASEVMEATLDKYPDRGGISHNMFLI